MHSSPKYMYQFILVIVVLILSSLACNAILSDADDDPTPSGVVQGGSPDLVISTGHAGMEVTGSCLDEYGPIITKICVENRGNASASLFLLGVSEGTNWTVNGLDPGETVCFESELDLSAATVTADVNNEVAESNENNNTWTIPVPTPPVLCNQEVEEPTPAFEPDISFQGVSFSYDDSLATSVTPETVPEEAEAGIDSWNTPDYIQFIFNGYPLPDAFHTPRIMVFPVDAYNAINPTAGDSIYQLNQLLQSQPENPEEIPFLPVFPAAQYMQAQVRYFRFQNGEGVRFLTQYGQDAWPLSNDEMFYTFQGITDDGQFYISAVLPISHPSLPDPETVTMDDAFYEDFMGYIAVKEGQLSAESPDSFTPTLLVLDAMIESLLVAE
jgi:hypothetical protein